METHTFKTRRGEVRVVYDDSRDELTVVRSVETIGFRHAVREEELVRLPVTDDRGAVVKS